MKHTIVKYALFNAVATALYIAAVATSFFYIPKLVGSKPDPHTPLIPLVMLSLLVFSASLCGILVFGRPVMWYLDNRKKEAVSLLFCTLSIFFVITIPQ